VTHDWFGRWLGKPFVHPLYDYLAVGGGLSLILGWLAWRGTLSLTASEPYLIYAFLFCNSAHFAASTVRLYTKPGSFETWPRLTRLVPIVALALILLAVAFGQRVGWYVTNLYLAWSPFHYAAQTYGLAAIYALHSGVPLGASQQRYLKAASLLPFLQYLIAGVPQQIGLGWFVSAADLVASPNWALAIRGTSLLLAVAAFLAPVGLYFLPREAKKGFVPILVPLLLWSNAAWWVLFSAQAFALASISHAVQYLTIVLVLHHRTAAKGSLAGGSLVPLVKFYAGCLALGYALFHCLPYAYLQMGFGYVESVLMVVAAINIHHFIVDAYIWKVRSDPQQRRLLEPRTGKLPAAPGAPAAAA
jgi:hypothetical protein